MNIMTQVNNVLYILLLTVILSIVASMVTLVLDKSFDIPELVKEIPHFVLQFERDIS